MLAAAIATGVLGARATAPTFDFVARPTSRGAAADGLAGVDLPVLRRRVPREDAGLPAARLDARRLQGDAAAGAGGVLRRSSPRSPPTGSCASCCRSSPTPACTSRSCMLLIALASILYGSAMAFTTTGRAADPRLLVGRPAGLHHAGDLRAAGRPGRPGRAAAGGQPRPRGGAARSSSSRCWPRAPAARRTSATWAASPSARRCSPTLFLIVALANLAMPGSSNFVGEFLILLGVFKAKIVIAIVAFIGVVLASVYTLRAVHPRDAQPRRAATSSRARSRSRDGARARAARAASSSRSRSTRSSRSSARAAVRASPSAQRRRRSPCTASAERPRDDRRCRRRQGPAHRLGRAVAAASRCSGGATARARCSGCSRPRVGCARSLVAAARARRASAPRSAWASGSSASSKDLDRRAPCASTT